ncbi:peptidylprolyl isomerase [Lignipirellula cremea]|nr:peptidylprolyl isomerase [Lignipirellula cremea]
MDACKFAPSPRRWKRWASLALGIVAIAATCVAVRQFGRLGTASAQAPATHPASAPAPRSGRLPGGDVVSATQPTTLAIVNGEPISRQELAQECLRRYGHDVLEAMMNRYLIMNACQKHNANVTQEEVDAEINRMAQKFGLSTERYLGLLRDERNIEPAQYGRDIVWPTLALRKLAADRIVVSQEEINQTLESELGERVKVRMISVKDPQQAEQIRQMASTSPDDFGRFAKEYSQDPNSAASWGLIPPIRRHIGAKEVEEAVFALSPGQISQVVSLQGQYLIFRCEARIAASHIPPEHRRDAEQRIIDHLRDKKLRVAASEIFRTLQEETKPVNVMNDPQLAAQYPGVAAQVGGLRITIREVSDECVKRHGQDVLNGEINRKVLVQELARQGKTVPPQEIDAEIARAAVTFGYQAADGSPDVDGWLKHVTEPEGATVELYVRDAVWPTVALKLIVGEEVQITEEDLKKGFEANFGERVEVLAIVLPNMREAQKVWKLARDNPTDKFFGDLAEQYSVEPISKNNRGKVPPIQLHGGQPRVEEEAFRLRPGELSGIVSQGETHIILRCLGRTQPVVTDFEAVRSELHRDIHEKKMRLKMAEKFDQLTSGAQIDNYLAGTTQSPKGSEVANRSSLGRRVPFRQTSSQQ